MPDSKIAEGQKPKTAKSKKAGSKPDIATIGGLVLAVGGIVGGLVLEKGNIGDIIQGTAALIVLGGTFGAVLVSMPLPTVIGALKRLKVVLFEKSQSPDTLVDEIIEYATKARKNGLVSLEQECEHIADPFLSKALTLAVDGTDIQEIRKMLELEIGLREHYAESEAKVFESAGGYAPTIGIIGAVLGLIQVMKSLSNIDEVGRGIAVAFVATVYGVSLANLFLLPAANKIKCRAHHEVQMKELILEGVLGIVEGLNPKIIRSKLDAYIDDTGPRKVPKPAKAGAPKTAAKPAEA
jgi:chemotaxis protein MotA